MERERIAENFYRDEFACKCGCGCDDISEKTVEIVQAIRSAVGPIEISSGCRCEAHNKAVGGVNGSQHVKGTAADLHSDLPPRELFDTIKMLFNAGAIPALAYCQRYPWGCHVDTGPTRKNRFNG